MKSKFTAALVAALALGTVAVRAPARPRLITGTAVAGAGAASASGWPSVRLPRARYACSDCYLSPRYDRFGNVIGHVKVCNY